MSKFLIDSIDLSDYYQMADAIVKEIISKEVERTDKNYNKLKNDGIIITDQFRKDMVTKNILKVTNVVSSAILRSVLIILERSEEQIMKDILERGDSDDFSRQP